MLKHEFESSVLPQFFPAHWLEEASDIVFANFPSRVRIGYVMREEGQYSYVMQPTLEESGLSRDALHACALKNLEALPLPNLKVAKTPGGCEAFLAESDDNFTAVRILLPRVQRGFARELGDEYLVAIPCRDWFFCWSKSQAVERQAHNRSEARKVFVEDEYNLTPDILLYSKGSFALHEVQEG